MDGLKQIMYGVTDFVRMCAENACFVDRTDLIRERGTHLDSLLERMQEPRVRRIVEPVMLGENCTFCPNDDDYRYVLDLGLLVEESDGLLGPANPMYTETIGRYLTRDDQDDMKQSVPEMRFQVLRIGR